tara:strand:- start:66 stop:251 length:186 start_codon:yes stop_codon:yes gene_type:complete
MITLLVGLLVLTSLALVVTVPVALATPGEWEASKSTFNKGFQVWIFLVAVIATTDGITSSL